MRYLTVTECEVPMGMRQEFISTVQGWEKSAADLPVVPQVHAVYLNSEDPAKVLILTQFNSREDADKFAATGLMQDFQQRLLNCSSSSPKMSSFDLFYALGPEGAQVVFGENTSGTSHK